LAHTFEFLTVHPSFLDLIENDKYIVQSNYLDEIVTIVDILTTLTNVDMIETKVKFDNELMIQLMTGIKKMKEIKAETKDKIDVILAIFCKINEFM
jgi:hypothetical protein